MMHIYSSKIKDVYIVENYCDNDERGFFLRLFCQEELGDVLSHRVIQQINHSCTLHVGAIRGFHFQNPPYAEMKLIRCIKGRVWDVVLDLRKGSATFLQWYAEELSADNSKMIVIPEGCAHAFQVLDANSELLYLHTNFYKPEAEGGVHVLDPYLSIDWPLPVKDLSSRDKAHPFIDGSFSGIEL